jgi:hypothetical protein
MFVMQRCIQVQTDRIHRVWRHLKDAVEYEGATLEEDVTPVPPVILYDVVCLDFYPEVECD